MKSLKRTLSLVLVLVMVLGLVGISAGASFKDEAKINYKEAVGVMTGIGALVGYPDGTFNGTGTVTREEAVKTVVYAVLGADVAKTLAGTATGFADVDAGRWSSGVIAYAVSRGIINGRDSKTFDPTGNVTANEVGKMMLCAAGYGKQGEFIGSSWELNTAVLANKVGLFAGSKATNNNAPATREETALYTFNGLTNPKAVMVNYSKLEDAYKPVAETALGEAKVTTTIGVATYGLHKVTSTVTGITGYTWENGQGKEVFSFIADEKVLGTITNGTKISAVTSNVSPKYIAALDASVVYYHNGVKVTATTEDGADGKLFVKAADNLLYVSNGSDKDDVEYSVKGATVSLYAGTGTSAKNIVKVSIVEKTIDTVDINGVKVTARPNQDSVVVVDLATTPDLTGTDKTIVGYEGLVKGDVVLYYTMGTKTYVEKAVPFKGAVTAIAGSGTNFTIGGKAYEVAGLKTFIGAAPAFTDKDQTYYTDSNGYLVAKVGPTAVIPTNYALVLTYLHTAANPFTGTTESSKALLLLADGTKGVYNLVTNAGKVKDDALVAGTLLKYVFAADGKTISTATKVVNEKALDAAMTITNKVPTVSIDLAGETAATNYMTSNTVFFFYDDSVKTNIKSGVVKGIANVPTTTVASGETVHLDATSGVLGAIVLPAASGIVVGTANYAYITSAEATRTLAEVAGVPTEVYTYNAIVDGKATTVSTLATGAVTVGIKTVAKDSTGYYTIADATSAQDKVKVTLADASYFVCGTLYNITPKTLVYKASFAADGTTITGLEAAPISVTTTKTTTAIVVSADGTNADFVIWYAK